MAAKTIDFESHRTDILLENAAFLASWGTPYPLICERLGVSEDCLDKAIERRIERGSDTHPDQEPGVGHGTRRESLRRLRGALP